MKVFNCDFNWVRYASSPADLICASTAHDWAFVDPDDYFAYHLDIGNNTVYCQAYAFGGYAFYPTRLGPVAPGPGQELLPRLYARAREAGLPFWSYFCVGADLVMNSHRPQWTIADDPAQGGRGYFMAPESPWTDLLCARVAEFLHDYPVDWLLFDWFVYGSLKPDTYVITPAPYREGPFREICGRDMPGTAAEITPEENLRYKREVLARQFARLRDTVRAASPATKIIFNVPYWAPAEALWVGHPMLTESDGLFAECSRADVMEWLLSVRQPGQRVMTTIIGRTDEGECDPNSWRTWHERECDFFGYAWGTPPDFRPLPVYDRELAITRAAFHAMG
jgi:hypothetical protein